ncbi:mannan endo-1,4-beta-mannosidase 6-like [Solanum verrucosum]|uniref:mannan endo-1,4-beta-mannosidase 6-like n=1 Tax=Solanum verrucosum TaxID=315347 RepID=UPI0020D0BD47|nr:mannan endo-1,4-beta-mannosidase 6-like [Solanum verrucosum]
MDTQWRDKKLYPALGIFTIFFLLYLSFNDNFNFTFPQIFLRQPYMGFVGVNETRFFIKNENPKTQSLTFQELYINGWNSYWLMEESVWVSSRFRVSKMLKRGAEMGLSVCRTWAFSDGGGPNDLQLLPGVFNERVFKGLDFVIVEARKHNIRLILSLVNNLKAYGGTAQYMRWAREAGTTNVSSSRDAFFTNPTVKAYYKSFVKAIVTRKNSISGVKYSEEPAIFAWELINEPRCESSSSAAALQAWIAEMAGFVKSLDQKHLVTIGLEGFYGVEKTGNVGLNPGKWAASLGVDFIENSAIENIDFTSVHAYPHSWIKGGINSDARVDFLSHWVDSHISEAEKILKKPVLFTEVGFPSSIQKNGLYDRNIFLKIVYDKIYESAKKKKAGAGALVWQLLVEGMERYGDQFSFIAWKHPSTYKLMVEQSCRLLNISFQGLTHKKLNQTNPCFG